MEEIFLADVQIETVSMLITRMLVKPGIFYSIL